MIADTLPRVERLERLEQIDQMHRPTDRLGYCLACRANGVLEQAPCPTRRANRMALDRARAQRAHYQRI